jgi:hypothetical protein
LSINNWSALLYSTILIIKVKYAHLRPVDLFHEEGHISENKTSEPSRRLIDKVSFFYNHYIKHVIGGLPVGRNISADEVMQEHIDRMGNELGELYTALWREVAWLHAIWREYRELYGTRPSRIELINAAAPHFFRVVQDCLWDQILLGITKLISPLKSSGRDNLTLRRLPALANDEAFATKLQNVIDSTIKKCSFCQDQRNKRIAHFDLALSLGASVVMEPTSRAQVKEALASIAEIMNIVSEHYLSSTTIYDVRLSPYDSVSMLYVLDDGLQLDKARRMRLEAGQSDPHDWETRDI